MPALHAWESFYVIIGAAAGALIGLQFVVLTLIAERPSVRVAEAGAAFVSPTIVHFSVILMISGILSAPWHSIVIPAGLWAIVGIFCIVYVLIVVRRMGRQKAYKPAFEDHMFHLILPLLGYTILVGAAFVATAHVEEALFAVAGATLVVLFAAIHNAWDGISYHVYVVRPAKDAKSAEKKG